MQHHARVRARAKDDRDCRTHRADTNPSAQARATRERNPGSRAGRAPHHRPRPAPPPTTAPAPPPTTAPAPPPTTAPAAPPAAAAPAPAQPATPAVYYPNCDAAKAAGAAPLHIGDPGYSTKLDRDRDGVACES